MLAKYDADKKEFHSRFTHALPQVQKEMMAKRHEVKSYIESTLNPKYKEACELGVKPLSPAAMSKCLSLVQADLLGASISGENVEQAQLESMLQVRALVCFAELGRGASRLRQRL